jgi:hypothetical protein
MGREVIVIGHVGSPLLAEVIEWASGGQEFLKSKWEELNHV